MFHCDIVVKGTEPGKNVSIPQDVQGEGYVWLPTQDVFMAWILTSEELSCVFPVRGRVCCHGRS